MTNVVPSAKMPITAVANRMPEMFDQVRNRGLAAQKNRISTIRVPKASPCWSQTFHAGGELEAGADGAFSSAATTAPVPLSLMLRLLLPQDRKSTRLNSS